MHSLVVGIEHLMTGVQFCADMDGHLTFGFESPSMVKVTSDKPFQAWWKAKDVLMDSTEEPDNETKFGTGEIEWWAQVMGPVMYERYHRPVVFYTTRENHPNPPAVPSAVIRALHNKFGATADDYIAAMRWDGLNKCYMLQWAGMWLGIEIDGYIHS